MKKTLSIFIVLFGFVSLVQAQSSHYYGINSLTPLVEEVSGGKTCRDITLFGGVQIQDCTVGDKATTAYLLPNHLKSSQVLVDSSKAIISNCLYSPYGEISAEISDSDKKNCKYTGTYDWESETQTFQSPTRRHEPSSQRFLSLDPNRQTFSPYTAVMGNPVNKLDLNGLQPRDYDLAEMSGTFNHKYVNTNFTIDADSLATFKQTKVGNAFVAIIERRTGKIYMNPLTPRREGTSGQRIAGDEEFEGVARLKGAPTAPIEHGAGGAGLTAHEQLLKKIVAMKNPTLRGTELASRVTSAGESYIGFSVRHEAGGDIHLVAKSRSLNNSKFRDWIGHARNEEEAYAEYLRSYPGYEERLNTPGEDLHYAAMADRVFSLDSNRYRTTPAIRQRLKQLYKDPNAEPYAGNEAGFGHLRGLRLRRFTVRDTVEPSELTMQIDNGMLPRYIVDPLTSHFGPIAIEFLD